MLLHHIDSAAARLMGIEDADFREPAGEPAMLPPDSVSWRVFRNPVTMYVGGIAAVLLELGEPRVRHGVWDHTSFRHDPATRMRRTGLAAMITVYGARSRFEALAGRVNRMHARVRGETDDGRPYVASDPELLLWVQATASWAFLEAYRCYAVPLGQAERDLFYAEAKAGAALYGVEAPPANEAEMAALMARMRPQLEPSPAIDELIAILRSADILPRALRPLQRLGVRAAIDLLPAAMRGQLGLAGYRFGRRERALLKLLARGAGRFELPSSPARQAAARLARARTYGPGALAPS
ncbi:oxygenase MpaB family protein [Sphingomonas sp. DG1-23]|uniref:oxygenase MpaB family protein n=1 Tax=Sphingomonas sp. DG1-23 TaxID=3068316 RepID=UPI00273D8D5F|nr:oxygenase MpaB family protein [Sphingomonas sp. DG1-23]MDP5278919.1 oxygenase MpaB family protein [Sphingomonas sp. DG1-23]